jgi:phosphatidylserine/phosphatidylglycerophosphate/cardiolipin synthase-like enzyme
MLFRIKCMSVVFLSLGLNHACSYAMTGDQKSTIAPIQKVPDAQQSNADGKQCSLLDCIHAAKDYICVAMHQLKAMKIAEELVKAYARGVKIWVICDTCTKDEQAVRLLIQHGIKVFVWSGDDPRTLRHHQFVLIDEDIVLIGSFNWTRNANGNNREHVTVIKSKAIYDKFFDEFVEKLLPSSQRLFVAQGSN